MVSRPNIQMARPNLDNLMVRADNPPADAVQTITKIQNPLACLKTLGRITPRYY